MKKIVYIIFVALLAAVAGPVCGQTNRTLGNIPTGWRVQAGSVDFTATEASHEVQIPAGVDVVLTPTNPSKVRNVTLVDAPTPTPSCRRITLDTVQHHFVAQDCDTLTGTLTANVKISIADGATVTLNNASISYSSNGADYAGLTLLGDGTIVLADGTTNTIIGGLDGSNYSNWPGIFVPAGKTLTINGNTGVLNAARGLPPATDEGSPAGIGAAWGSNCGNIVINGGVIYATGGNKGAGIGGCGRRGCGNITINGGTVTAISGELAAGIGLGGTNNSSYADGGTCGDITISGGIIIATGGEWGAGIGTGFSANTKSVTVTKTCGNILISGGTITATGGEGAAGIGTGKTNTNGIINIGTITITNGVTLVTATKGSGAPNSIGKGTGTSITCGTVTFGTQQMYNGTTWTTTPTNGQTYGGLNFTIKTTTITDDTWELTCRRVDLSQITADSIMQDGDVLTGTLTANVKISIADGATVTLNNVTINGTNSNSYKWAGITCEDNATIILKDGTENTVTGFYENYPGIYVPANSTLTIKGGSEGTGKLIASSNGYGAGIGGWYYNNCGNINIQSGDIKATGGQMAAGIGGAGSGNFGTITITGGTIEATGGDYAAGIGSGNNGSCGDIMITSDVTSVTATKGSYAPNSIGAGLNGSCGTVTIGSATGAITDSPYTYPPQP